MPYPCEAREARCMRAFRNDFTLAGINFIARRPALMQIKCHALLRVSESWGELADYSGAAPIFVMRACA